ncbi:MAG: NAD(P)-dependent dehydrogenase (short-subunit alcohol dehydrogenase family), partial [Candidatus Aldehydirespiratoraceae bacterium]
MSSTKSVLEHGNVAVITGGASGIGLAVAEQLIARGMRVVLADIDEPKLRDVEARLTEAGADVAGVVCDTASSTSVADLAEATLARFGGCHLLFNNAGIAGVGDAWDGPLELWDRVIGINLYGVIHGIRSFLPIMTEQGVGHIVNTASIAGLIAIPGAAPYNATKHGVVAISESLFLELGAIESPVGVSV